MSITIGMLGSVSSLCQLHWDSPWAVNEFLFPSPRKCSPRWRAAKVATRYLGDAGPEPIHTLGPQAFPNHPQAGLGHGGDPQPDQPWRPLAPGLGASSEKGPTGTRWEESPWRTIWPQKPLHVPGHQGPPNHRGAGLANGRPSQQRRAGGDTPWRPLAPHSGASPVR